MNTSPLASPKTRGSTPASMVTVFCAENSDTEESDTISVHEKTQTQETTPQCCCIWCCLKVYSERTMQFS
jgi:hypothetical protein